MEELREDAALFVLISHALTTGSVLVVLSVLLETSEGGHKSA